MNRPDAKEMKRAAAFGNPPSLGDLAAWRDLPRFRFPLSAFRFLFSA
jgi:hypothetical protein